MESCECCPMLLPLALMIHSTLLTYTMFDETAYNSRRDNEKHSNALESIERKVETNTLLDTANRQDANVNVKKGSVKKKTAAPVLLPNLVSKLRQANDSLNEAFVDGNVQKQIDLATLIAKLSEAVNAVSKLRQIEGLSI